MAFDPSQLRGIERKRYVLEHAPALLCALIVRRASSEPSSLIDLAIGAASDLFDKVDLPPQRTYDYDNIVHESGHA